MTKIYEALENAGQEQAGAPQALPSAAGELKRIPKALEAKLLALLNRIDASVEAPQGKVVLFAGMEANNHASRVLCAFAKLAAMRMNRRVLLVASSPFSHVKRAFGLTGVRGWEYLLAEDAPLENYYTPVSGASLAVSQLTLSEDALPGVHSSPKFRETIGNLRGMFDIILVDVPPFGASADGALLSTVADGAVLVVEARKTRWQAVRNAIDQIEAQRGTVLGVVLNQRRYYIPSVVYKFV